MRKYIVKSRILKDGKVFCEGERIKLSKKEYKTLSHVVGPMEGAGSKKGKEQDKEENK